MDVFFSHSLMGFIPADWKTDGTYSDTTWPDDAVILTDAEITQYWKKTPPDGKQLGCSAGRPTWVDLPLPTADELISISNAKKLDLLKGATEKINILQDASDLNMASDEEISSLSEWKKYRVLVNRIDTSASDISWPKKPD